MKFQCSCGAKYAIDVTPGMPPVTFVCQNCKQDYSAFINELIRKELGQEAGATPAPAPTSSQPTAPSLRIASGHSAAAAPAPQPAAPPPPSAPASTEAPRLRINKGHAPEPAAAAAPAPEQAAGSKYCARHKTELTTDQCQICHKPICPQCLETFGPFCSPFCRNKVEGASMSAPVHVGLRQTRQNEFWNKTGLISKIVGSIVVVLAGFWFWYSWFGSVPHKAFFVRWDDISHSGSSRLVGDQIVFLHGGTLARYNVKTKQKVWSLDLVTPQQVDDVLKQEDAESTAEQHKYGHASDAALEIPALRKKHARMSLEEAYSLYGTGQNVWLANGNILTHYDWNSGNVTQTVTLTNSFEGITPHGNELWASARGEDGSQSISRVNMDDGTLQTTEIANPPGKQELAQNGRRHGGARDEGGGLPLSPTGEDRPLNPQKVQQQVQNMPLPNRIALPALLAGSEHQRQINSELRQEDTSGEDHRQALKAQAQAQSQQFTDLRNFELIPDGDSYVAFSATMMEEHIVEREAMKAPPKTSVISSGNLSTANEGEAINEQLNEMQRNAGADKVQEDQSRYQIALRRPDSTQPDWIGEVIGPPQLFPLKSVNVLTAGKTVTVFDKSNKQLWKADLTYTIPGGGLDEMFHTSQYGEGPCVEHDGALYVFDQAVLTSYDLNTGNVRWRLPSVGVVGLFFDDQGNIYINTTTGNPDDIKYSRQIDVGKQTLAVVTKVNAKSGKTLWTSHPGGYICYLSGPYIYTYETYEAGDDDETLSDAIPQVKDSYLRLIRINPGNGHVMWDHQEDRSPVDIQFDKNNISAVFKKEVEVLHYFSF